MQNFRALGAPPPHPRASGGWGLCPQTPSLRRLGASPPDPHWPPAAGGSAPRPPKQPPPLRISGYAPVCESYDKRLNILVHGLKESENETKRQTKKNFRNFFEGWLGTRS